MDGVTEPIVKHRGAVFPDQLLPHIQARDYRFVQEQKLGYFLSYETEHFQFHAVDRFASFPLFYCIRNGRPYVSQKIDDLLIYLSEISFDPIGYFGTGGLLKGIRSGTNTPVKGIRRVPAGHYLLHENGVTSLHRYWAFSDFQDRRFTGSFEEASEELGYLIKQGVRRCYEFAPDAELHLSGGLDSGSVAALLCRLSNRERIAHAVIMNDQNHWENEDTEAGFTKKYQKVYPTLKIKYHRNYLPSELYCHETNMIPELSNWFFLPNNYFELKIVKSVASSSKKVIITGLGGDELASYGKFGPNPSLLIRNDREAKRYLEEQKWKRKRGALLSGIKAFLKLDQDFGSHLLGLIYGLQAHDYSRWVTPYIRESTKGMLWKPQLDPGVHPLTHGYRLEVLSRSHTIYRSELWNYLGASYNVDYLHPLLDADLVDFCLTLHPSLYLGRPKRDLFKKALQKDIPKPLLTGVKRRIAKMNYDPEIFNRELAQIERNFRLVRGTYAASIFDLQKLGRLLKKATQLNKYNSKLFKNGLPQTQTLVMYLLILQAFVAHAAYLNLLNERAEEVRMNVI